MRVKINGETEEIPNNSSIHDVVISRNIKGAVIVELNGEIIKRDKWSVSRLNPGDVLELVRMIGGG